MLCKWCFYILPCFSLFEFKGREKKKPWPLTFLRVLQFPPSTLLLRRWGHLFSTGVWLLVQVSEIAVLRGLCVAFLEAALIWNVLALVGRFLGDSVFRGLPVLLPGCSTACVGVQLSVADLRLRLPVSTGGSLWAWLRLLHETGGIHLDKKHETHDFTFHSGVSMGMLTANITQGRISKHLWHHRTLNRTSVYGRKTGLDMLREQSWCYKFN